MKAQVKTIIATAIISVASTAGAVILLPTLRNIDYCKELEDRTVESMNILIISEEGSPEKAQEFLDTLEGYDFHYKNHESCKPVYKALKRKKLL